MRQPDKRGYFDETPVSNNGCGMADREDLEGVEMKPGPPKCERDDCKAEVYLYQGGTLIRCGECGERYQTRKDVDEAKKVWARIVEENND